MKGIEKVNQKKRELREGGIVKRWFLQMGLALFVGAFIGYEVAEGYYGDTTKPFSLRFKLWSSYHWLSMSDWNSYKENVNEKQLGLGWKEFPSFHHGFVLGGEFSCLFMDIFGVGFGTGLILGKGPAYEDSNDKSDSVGKYRMTLEYKHSAKALPFLFTVYFTPRVPPLRFTIGGGAGFYHGWSNFDIKRNSKVDYNYGAYYRDHRSKKSNLSGNGLGVHGSFGLEIEIPNTSISLFEEVKLRYAKIVDPAGEVDEYSFWEYYHPHWGFQRGELDTTYYTRLKYAYNKDNGYEYFGPLSKEEEERYDKVRDGVVDFSGFEFAIGITFRF